MNQDQNFKQAARRFASGVTIVSTRTKEGYVYAVTVSSFSSLSIDPLLVTVSINKYSPLIEFVRESGIFAVSVLGATQQQVSRYFATPNRGITRDWLPDVPAVQSSTGSPIVAGCLSYFDCNVHTILDGGDHVILVGQVASAGGIDGEPLLYFDGSYRELSSQERTEQAVEAGLALLDLPAAELGDAQRAIEPALAALAVERAGEADVTRLEKLINDSADWLDDAEKFTALGMDFHDAIAEAARNRPLRATLTALRQLQQTLLAAHTDEGRASTVLAIHRDILAHFRSGDSHAAALAMAAHVDEMNTYPEVRL